MHTRESITALLTRSDKAVEKALVALYRRQTADERALHHTGEVNGMGFSRQDAEILSSFAEQVLGIGEYTINDQTFIRRFPRHLSARQLAVGRKRLVHYAGQLAEIANGNPPPEAVEPRTEGLIQSNEARAKPRDTEINQGDTVINQAVPVPDEIWVSRHHAQSTDEANDPDWDTLVGYGEALAGYNSQGERWRARRP